MIIGAKYIIPDSRTLLQGSAVLVIGGRTAAVGPYERILRLSPGSEVLDFPNGVLLPAFINSHCHIELDFCKGKVGYDGNFIYWLQSVRDMKREASPNPVPSAYELLSSGVSTVVDHWTMPIDFDRVRATGLRYYGFHEVFGSNIHEPEAGSLMENFQSGIAPHAPYTTSREVVEKTAELSKRLKFPISTHLSEMDYEIEYIKTGTGDVVDLLKKADVYEESFKGYGVSPIRYFYDRGILGPRTYSVHTNYYEEGDLYLLKRANPTIVYCPKSHNFFGHPKHPIETYLKLGLNLAVGTDSYASNDSLNLLLELRILLKKFPAFPRSILFEMVTRNGLKPIGRESRSGKIKAGMDADLILFDKVEGESFDEIIDEVFTQRSRVDLIIVGGKVIDLTGKLETLTAEG